MAEEKVISKARASGKTAESKASLTGEVYNPAPQVVEQARIKDWEAIARFAAQDLQGFWAQEAEQLEWYRKWDKVLD